ncbi:MAG: hypothetical protein H6714_00615 [Myxococcales bacterium]|nr:hypothetical protein [Myxococcales bacterium]
MSKAQFFIITVLRSAPLALLAAIGLVGCEWGDKDFKLKGLNEWAEAISKPNIDKLACHKPSFAVRPDSAVHSLRSRWFPISVHAEPHIPWASVQMALETLEGSYARWQHAGRPLPLPDAGRSGDSGFDLFLLQRLRTPCAQAHLDTIASEQPFDAGIVFATVAVPDEPSELAGCADSAFIQASLLSYEPAEAEPWRLATGTYLSWAQSGQTDFAPEIFAQLHESWRGWLEPPAYDRLGTALLWHFLEHYKQTNVGDYTFAMWERSRQKSPHPTCLLESPHLWEVIASELRASKDGFEQAMASFAVARYFLSVEKGAHPATVVASSALPTRLHFRQEGIETFGSAYARLDLDGPDKSKAVQAWLTGEQGVLWSLLAVRLDVHGQEISHVTLPVRHDPKSFLRIEPTPATDSILWVVTNLGRGVPGYNDSTARDLRAATLTIDVPDEN